MSAKAWDIFVNVDGQYGRTLCPLPHAQLDNAIIDRATVEKWDQVSCHDRFQQIKHKLTTEEQGLLVSLLLHISGGHMETSSLWDMIRSHALLMYSSDNFGDVWLRYKLRDGQTELARRIFADAVDAGLEYAFSTQVASIVQDGLTDQPSTVRTVAGEAFRARKVVCTVPLNVLKDVGFEPPLSARRREAINIGHVNQMSKIHADVGNPELERWNGMRFPGQLMYGYGDGVLRNGDVHLVAFGADEGGSFVPEKEPLKAVDALEKLHPMNVKRMVRRDETNPFWPVRYGIGVSCFFPEANELDLHFRYSTTGAPIPSHRAVPRGGGLVTCPSIRTSSRAAMATFSSPPGTGRTDGGRQSMGRWNKALSPP